MATTVLYNFTGQELSYFTKKVWSGQLKESVLKDQKIQNDQSAEIPHEGKTESLAAVVYKGKDKDDKVCEYMISWRYPSIDSDILQSKKSVYFMIENEGYFKGEEDDKFWAVILVELMKKGTQYCEQKDNGSLSLISANSLDDHDNKVIALFSIPGAPKS